MKQRRVDAVFLDRDGTINRKAPEGDYVKSPGELEMLPGAAEAIRALNDADVWVGVVTNQRGIALGRMTTDDLEAVNDVLRRELRAAGAHIDALYFCPHDVGSCDCRKPAPGLLLRARDEHPGLDFRRAAIVGDSDSDVEAGRRVGLLTVLLRETDGRPARADHVASSLGDAVSWLLGQ